MTASSDMPSPFAPKSRTSNLIPDNGNTPAANNIQQNFTFIDFPQRFIKNASDVIAFDTPQPQI